METPRNQPYSKPLRAIAAIIADSRDDTECVCRIRQYLAASGVPIPQAKTEE